MLAQVVRRVEGGELVIECLYRESKTPPALAVWSFNFGLVDDLLLILPRLQPGVSFY